MSLVRQVSDLQTMLHQEDLKNEECKAVLELEQETDGKERRD